jgi:hypothetical protein
MSDTTAAMQRIGSGAGRVARAWRTLTRERRLAALSAIALFLSLFLPWYQVTVVTGSRGSTVVSAGLTVSGWGSFGFVEAVVLLVAGAVLGLLFVRSEGRALPLPEFDGEAILAAGGFSAFLVVWRIFDRQGASGHGQFATVSGIEWGIIIALVATILLTYAGSRIRAAHQPQSPPGGAGARAPTGPRPPSDAPPARQRPVRAAPADPAATRVSAAKPAAAPAKDPAATKVSAPPRQESLFGPPVLPEDPPTMRLETREHRTEPLNGEKKKA